MTESQPKHTTQPAAGAHSAQGSNASSASAQASSASSTQGAHAATSINAPAHGDAQPPAGVGAAGGSMDGSAGAGAHAATKATKNSKNLSAASGTTVPAPHPTTTHTARHRIGTVIGVLLCVILIPVVIINCTLIAKQFLNEDEVPSVGGVFPMIVLTDSMAGTFNAGSLIFCTSVDPSTIQVGDIICFYDPAGTGVSTITHRVQEITSDDAGTTYFVTKGDANNTADKRAVAADKVLGEYAFHIEGLGNLAMFMQTTPGLIVFVVLPIVLLVAYDVIRRRIYDKRKDANADALAQELEALRAQQNKRE